MFTFLKLIFVCFTPLVSHLPIYNHINTNNEIVETKKRYNFYDAPSGGGFAGGGIAEFTSYSYFLAFQDTIKNNDNIFNSGVSYSSFMNGTELIIDTTNLPIALGNLNRSSGYPWSLDVSNSVPITSLRIHLDSSNEDYTLTFTIRFYINSSEFYRSQTGYYFLNNEKTRMISVAPSISYFGSYTTIGLNSAVITYAVNYFKGLLPSSIDSFDNQTIYNNGYDSGFEDGYVDGLDRGKEIASDPASDIYETTYNVGYQAGRTDGITEASANSGVPALIFSGILNVALLPVDIFLQMFQYEVFGINIAGLISGLLTVAMVITVLRFVLGGKTKDD